MNRNSTSLTLDHVRISRELVEALNALVPERCPQLTDTDRDIWHYTGERSLVLKLITAFQRQEDKVTLIG